MDVPYVQSYTTLRLHPKISRLKPLLSAAAGEPVTRAHIVGWLHLLWHWTLEYSPGGQGDLSAFTAQEIADAAEWPHNPQAFVDALIEAGWLDRADTHLRVHDWWDYAGEMLRKRQARAASKPPPSRPPPPKGPSPPHPVEPAGFANLRALRTERRKESPF